MADNQNIPYNPAYIFRTGTLRRRRLTFCMLNGEYIGRTKSSLTGRRVKESVSFKKTMLFAAKLGRASAIAATVYRRLPQGWKLHSLYRQLVGVASQSLKNDDYTDEMLSNVLWQYLYSVGYRSDVEYEIVQESTATYQEPVVQETTNLKRCEKKNSINIRSTNRQRLSVLFTPFHTTAVYGSNRISPSPG